MGACSEKQRHSSMKRTLIFLSLFILVAVYFLEISIPRYSDGGLALIHLHDGTINGTVETPFLYRVLVPFLLQPFVGNNTTTYMLTYYAADVIGTCIMLVVFYAWFRRWVSEPYALVGVFITAVFLPMMFGFWLFSTTTPMEAVLITCGLYLLTGKQSRSALS